jgi:hypothetical protein
MGKTQSNIQVQKIGNEKMFGYNCVHVKITYTVKGLNQTANCVDEEWYSSEVPGAQYVSPAIYETHSPDVIQKIIATGCNGALVKRKTGNNAALLQLTSITKKDIPGALFVLPANYQPDKNTDLYGLQ